MFIKQLPIKKKYFLSLFFLGAIQMWIFFSPLKRQVLYFPNVLFKKKKKILNQIYTVLVCVLHTIAVPFTMKAQILCILYEVPYAFNFS